MKNPRLEKKRDFRRGTAKIRHERSMWKRWGKPGKRDKTVAEPVDPTDPAEPQMDEAAELYSEFGFIFEDGPNGSVSCRIQED